MGMIGNTLAQGLISGANIQDGTVDTPDLKDGAVTTAKHADGSVTNAKMASGAAVANIGYTPFNKAGDTLTGPLDLGGKKIRDTSGTGRVYHNITPYYDTYASGSTTGALVIDTTIPYNDGNMCSIKISGYSYSTQSPWEILIGGYFGENNFYSMRAVSQSHPFPYITAAKKTASNTMSFILGDVGGVYGTTVMVDKFMQSFSNQNSSYADGWTISRITSTSAYSSITTIPNSVPVLDVIDVLNVKPDGTGLDYTSDNGDGGGTSWRVVGSRVIDLYNTSGGHGGNWGYPVRIDVSGYYRLKMSARVTSTNTYIHGNTPTGNYKYTIDVAFGINGVGVGGKWDVDTIGNGTRVAAISGLTYLTSGANYQMTYSTNGYGGIKEIFIYSLTLERVL
jgi:hypothetical protein